MQTSDEVYIVHKFIPWWFIYDGERRTMKEQWEIAKSLCLLYSSFLAPACAQWFHIYRAKPDLASTSCTYAGQVLFLSVKDKLGITSVFLLFRHFRVSKLGWGGCRARWEATSGSSVDFGDVRCCGLSFFYILCRCRVRACWLEWGKHKAATEMILFLLSQPQRSLRPLNHQTKSIFLVYSGTFAILSSELAVNENQW